jgi:DNA polymerase IV
MRCVLFAEVPGFYAAVARADDPSLSARPVVVGGDPRKNGRVQAATADALSAGVTLEMSVLEALRQCPSARAVRTDMPRYREVSRRLFALLRGIEPQLEIFGLAACYADVSARADQAQRIAQELLGAVSARLGLPLRVGIGAGKFLARIAAEEVPGGERGVVRVAPGDEARFLGSLPASRLDGVGRKTAAALAGMGGHTIADVVRLGRDRLQAELGPHGLRIYACATGTDGEPVRGASHPKSLSRESTLPAEPFDVAVFDDQLAGLAQQLEEELARMGLAAGRVTVKIRFNEGTTTTRSATLPRPTAAAAELFRAAQLLLERTPAGARPARGLGIQLSLLAPAGETDRQLDLFSSG